MRIRTHDRRRACAAPSSRGSTENVKNWRIGAIDDAERRADGRVPRAAEEEGAPPTSCSRCSAPPAPIRCVDRRTALTMTARSHSTSDAPDASVIARSRAVRRVGAARSLGHRVARTTPPRPRRQGRQGAKKAKKAKEPKAGEKKVPPLFRSEAPLAMTLTTEHQADPAATRETNAPWRWATLTYRTARARPVEVPLKVRTRGIWRLKQLRLPADPAQLQRQGRRRTRCSTISSKPKLVNYCRDTDPYEQYILQECQLYRDLSAAHAGEPPRAAREDHVRRQRERQARSASATRSSSRIRSSWRTGTLAKILKTKGAGAGDLEPKELALAYLFEYLIGNLDFSFNGLHNTELLATTDGRMLPGRVRLRLRGRGEHQLRRAAAELRRAERP